MSSNRLLKTLLAISAVAVATLAGALYHALSSRGEATPEAKAAVAMKGRGYHCAMHATMVSDRPDACPICQMRMVPDEEVEQGSGASAPSGGGRVFYRSTMNPSEVSDKPGKDAMGMEMAAEEVAERPPEGPVVEGRASVKISPERRQLIGVRTAVVERKPLTKEIRTVGRVTFDEARLHHVHTKIGGWIERLYANTGEVVQKGQPLLTIYSPELLATAQEYLLALKARDRLAGSTLPSVKASGGDLVESARRRLLLYDLTEDQIDVLANAGEAPRTTTIYAPMTGHVIMRNVTHGEKIDSGTALLDLADLSRVWVLADVYEYELPLVHEGQEATMSLSYLPGRTFEGRITLIYPALEEATRTVKVRLEFPNPGLALKPDMYTDVEIRASMGEKLLVPESAVISTGERDLAFVDRGGGYFEPRTLTLGLRDPNAFEVISGLAEGERVLVSANFFVDSESTLKAALRETGGKR